MDAQEIEYRVFWLGKEYVKDNLRCKMVHFVAPHRIENSTDPELEDARLLLKLFVKELNSFNQKKETQITVMEKKLTAKNYHKSTLFKNVPVDKFRKLVRENPHLNIYELKELVQKNIA